MAICTIPTETIATITASCKLLSARLPRALFKELRANFVDLIAGTLPVCWLNHPGRVSLTSEDPQNDDRLP